MTSTLNARRGEIWWADGDPVQGHEQAGRRPWLIVSSSLLNRTGMVFAMPLSSKRLSRSVPLHVLVSPPEGGVTIPSLILCDQMRALDLGRLQSRVGSVASGTMQSVEKVMRRLLDLT